MPGYGQQAVFTAFKLGSERSLMSRILFEEGDQFGNGTALLDMLLYLLLSHGSDLAPVQDHAANGFIKVHGG